MDQLILPGTPPVTVEIRRSKRARRLSLRVSARDGRVRLTLPHGVALGEARAFAEARAGWIRGHLARVPAPRIPQPGCTIPVAGRPHRLEASGGRAARLGDGVITLPASAPEKTGARLAALFKALARERLVAACDRHAAALGRSYSAISLRDTRSRWGSCSAQGRLMFSWRLVMAPPEVLEYVAAHEVAHLVEMNHSPAFWAVVEGLHPGWQAPRRWLRDHGAELQAWQFRAP